MESHRLASFHSGASLPHLPPYKRVTVVVGHYGTGKTNLSLNLARDAAARGEKVTLVDFDIVNPYFRSSDHAAALRKQGIELVAPQYAGTTLEAPAITGAITGVLAGDSTVIVDAGGDDAGATALGRFSADFDRIDYDMLYVVNRSRNLTATPADAARIAREIEHTSRLSITGVVGNTHLQAETTAPLILESVPFVRETADLLGVPLRFVTLPRETVGDVGSALSTDIVLYPVDRIVRPPWESSDQLD